MLPPKKVILTMCDSVQAMRISLSYLCLTVDPAALGETALLGDRLDAPTLVELAAGPG